VFKEHASLVRIKTRGDQRTLRLAGRSQVKLTHRASRHAIIGYKRCPSQQAQKGRPLDPRQFQVIPLQHRVWVGNVLGNKCR